MVMMGIYVGMFPLENICVWQVLENYHIPYQSPGVIMTPTQTNHFSTQKNPSKHHTYASSLLPPKRVQGGPLPVINGVTSPYKWIPGVITPINFSYHPPYLYLVFLHTLWIFLMIPIQNPGDPIIRGKTSPSREKCLRRADRLPLLFVKLLLAKSVVGLFFFGGFFKAK